MFNKLRQLNLYNNLAQFFNRFQDIRFSGQVVFVLIILMISWSGVKAIQLNYDLQQKILKLNTQISVQKIINQNITYQNQYYSSNQFLELSARQNFGLGNAGETEIIIPKNVALSYTVTPTTTINSSKAANLPTWQKNIKDWYNFFLHRSTQG